MSITFRSTLIAAAGRRLRAVAAAGLLVGTAAGLIAGSLPASAFAAGAIEQLKSFSSTTRSAHGEFSQQLVKRAGQPAAAAKGEFAFSRPGRFRWEIQSPYQQLIVTDGSKLYFYDKDLKQVTVREVC